MKPLSIYRPVFPDRERASMCGSKESYALGMMQHLQDCEDWQRTMHEESTMGGWGVCQLWVMIHKDGRVARLADVCPMDKLRSESRVREERWLQKKLELAMAVERVNDRIRREECVC